MSQNPIHLLVWLLVIVVLAVVIIDVAGQIH